MFKNILVSLDYPYSEVRPLARAIDLAENTGAKLKIIDVVPEIPAAVQAVGMEEVWVTNRKRDLEAVVAEHCENGSVVTVLADGPTAHGIVEEVVRHGHDLVIRMTQHANALLAAFFGTTSLRIMRKCPCPVWILQPVSPSAGHRVAAAVDVTSTGEEDLAINRKILRAAAVIAKQYGGDLHVIYADGVAREDLDLVPDVPAEQWDEVISETKRDCRVNLMSLLEAELPGFPAKRVHLLSGKANTCIPKFVSQNAIDVLVMGSVARTGIAGFLMGNTAERILQQVRCSVLTVKPDGFICPISV